jgi:hypothetical protein
MNCSNGGPRSKLNYNSRIPEMLAGTYFLGYLVERVGSTRPIFRPTWKTSESPAKHLDPEQAKYPRKQSRVYSKRNSGS